MHVIFGAGGFAREVETLIAECSEAAGYTTQISAFVSSDEDTNVGKHLHGIEVVPETYFFNNFSTYDIEAYIAVGSPRAKASIYTKCINRFKRVCFPNLIHPTSTIDTRNNYIKFGSGVIICAQCVLTTDIVVGDFVHLNLQCTVGHDTVIENFTTVSPGVNLSGKVHIGRRCFIGTGASIIESISVNADTVIGSGATVVKNIVEGGTYVGTPAKKLHK